jgi:hypothetical protein
VTNRVGGRCLNRSELLCTGCALLARKLLRNIPCIMHSLPYPYQQYSSLTLGNDRTTRYAGTWKFGLPRPLTTVGKRNNLTPGTLNPLATRVARLRPGSQLLPRLDSPGSKRNKLYRFLDQPLEGNMEANFPIRSVQPLGRQTMAAYLL